MQPQSCFPITWVARLKQEEACLASAHIAEMEGQKHSGQGKSKNKDTGVSSEALELSESRQREAAER